MHILVSNDDGYLAEGIRKLNSALGSLARTTIMAPDRNRSGASNSLTLDVPLRVFQSEPGVAPCRWRNSNGLRSYRHFRLLRLRVRSGVRGHQ